ncbi:hypothetical protein [Caballeronia sp. dw_276]|uniref:hypothetical protein n=1 Tax=Caballeronia sp. dw_276 TaxID=2719795 RepID=UPI001BD5A79A|nr:hypothetical protein [Caballeronia sp. dw_276]
MKTTTSGFSACAATVLLVAVALALSLQGCVSRNPSADMRHTCEGKSGHVEGTSQLFDPATAVRPSPKPIVKVIEFTDNGELTDRCQLSDVYGEVKGLNEDPSIASHPKMIVFYVHGWKHDAALGDPDRLKFKELIEYLSAVETNRHSNRDVVGIYVAWPGRSVAVPGLDNLTFWARKGAADRVSESGNFSKIIGAVNSIRCQRKNPNDVIVAIGHSFGARILFSSISPMILYDLQMKHPGKLFAPYRLLGPPVDLTILLNPAFEASRYTALDSSRRYQESFSPNQPPSLLSISTSNDDATRLAFPVGQFIGTRWDERERTTLGNYNVYQTHTMKHDSPTSPDTAKGTFWYDHYCWGNICLARKDDDVQRGNPFLVAGTDASILDGHNGIWSEQFKEWMAHFIESTEEAERQSGVNRGTCF